MRVLLLEGSSMLLAGGRSPDVLRQNGSFWLLADYILVSLRSSVLANKRSMQQKRKARDYIPLGGGVRLDFGIVCGISELELEVG